MAMEAITIESFSVDGELESLLGMFNFDDLQCSSEEIPLGLSVLCNDDEHHHLGSNHHDQNHVLITNTTNYSGFNGASDDQENNVSDPFVATKQKAYSSSHNPSQETMLKRKLKMHGLVKSKKKQKISQESDNDDINSAWQGGQSLSNYNSSSDDDEKTLGETNINVPNPKQKARASKGAATDPQSLYARKRRERINERLKILQNLVPNGTKVDISTMLEEAVQYVKFLQLQIKLLSSDDLWMYAPLAYNGLDMGLHHNLLSRLT